MGSVFGYATKAGRRYLVRYKKPDGTHAAKRGFRTKREAEDYLAQKTASIIQNDYIDPGDARITIGELGKDWLLDQAAVLKPSSLHPLESCWRIHVEPQWGRMQVGDVRHSEVRRWVTALSAQVGATTVIRAYGILAAVMDIAVRDRRLADNPARGVRLPKKQPKRRVYLTHEQVALLAAQSAYPEVVYFLAYTGLRWGEATGLRVRDVDTARRRFRVHENAVLVNGHLHTGTPKSHAVRSVPYPEFLAPSLQASMLGKSPDELVFGDGTNHLRLPNSQNGWFVGAVRRAMKLDPKFNQITPHDLRHTAASLAISAGANVKAIQRMLGHASAAMTLDTYADLFDDDLDLVADALGRARAKTVVIHEAPASDPPREIEPTPRGPS
jgi:integrase